MSDLQEMTIDEDQDAEWQQLVMSEQKRLMSDLREVTIDDDAEWQQLVDKTKEKAYVFGLAQGEAKAIVKAFKQEESDQTMLEAFETLTPEKLSKIKKLNQPLNRVNILRVLLSKE